MFRAFFLMLILMSSVSFAQTNATPKVEKFDEFGSIGDCDFRSRLDSFLVELMNNPDLKGKVIIYKGLKGLPGQYDDDFWNYPKIFQNHFRFRKFDISRIDIEVVGYRDNQITELWVYSKDAKPPKPTSLKTKPKLPKDKTYLYSSGTLIPFYAETDPYFLLLPKYKAERDEEEKEYITKKDREESEKYYLEKRFNWLNSKFGKILKNDSKAYGEIIYYADEQKLDIEKIESILKEGKDKLVKENQLLLDKIKITFGGYRMFLDVESWIVFYQDKQPTRTPEEREI